MCLKYSLPLALLFSLVVAPGMAADDYARVVPLFDGTKNIVGESLAYPTTGPAKVTSLIVTMKPGETTGAHRHGVADLWLHPGRPGDRGLRLGR